MGQDLHVLLKFIPKLKGLEFCEPREISQVRHWVLNYIKALHFWLYHERVFKIYILKDYLTVLSGIRTLKTSFVRSKNHFQMSNRFCSVSLKRRTI